MNMWRSAVGLILIIAQFCMQQEVVLDDQNVMLRKVSRITNGTKSLMGYFPFIGSLIFYGSHKCGTSIISPDWVLSAAHCCYYGNQVVPDVAMEISVGNVYWHDGELHRVERKVVHEDYDPDRIINDIAVMKVRVPFKFGAGIGAVKFSRTVLPDLEKNISAIVLGWGQFVNNRSRLSVYGSDQLQHVNVTIVNIKACQKHYSDISSNNICVFTGEHKGTCNGDSGGPLVITHIEHSYMQVGVVSYGASCNNTVPEVYTRVSAYYSWIKTQIKKGGTRSVVDDEGSGTFTSISSSRTLSVL